VRVILFIGALLIAAIGAAGAYGYHWAGTPIGIPEAGVEVDIAAGSSVRAVAKQLRAKGIAIDEDMFVVLTRLHSPQAKLKAGVYEFRAEDTPTAILGKMLRGESMQSEIRFVEGWTFRQYRKIIDEHPDVRNDTKGLSDAEVLAKIGVTDRHPEGLFFPDTYKFAKGTSDILLLRRAHKVMQTHLQEAWDNRASNMPLKSAYEVLVMASIIEKETGRNEDRGMVSAVFNNRMRIGMRLQADPTVIYGIGPKFDGNIRRRDLQHDTPYNTYTRVGLPPTPIAMPSLASIRAAVQPAQSDVLYFVANRDGSSQFSRTLIEHNHAVARFLRQGG
jgi:UPF0755 protein